MKTLLICAFILIVVFIACRSYSVSKLHKGLNKKIAEGAIILDVRTTQEYASGHIEQSINISLGTLRERYIELDTNKTYITTCSHGLRSIKAETILKERGFKNVYNGGAWTDLEKLVNEIRKK